MSALSGGRGQARTQRVWNAVLGQPASITRPAKLRPYQRATAQSHPRNSSLAGARQVHRVGPCCLGSATTTTTKPTRTSVRASFLARSTDSRGTFGCRVRRSCQFVRQLHSEGESYSCPHSVQPSGKQAGGRSRTAPAPSAVGSKCGPQPMSPGVAIATHRAGSTWPKHSRCWMR